MESILAAVVFDSLGRHFIDLREWTMIVLGTESSAELSSVIRKRGKKDMLNVGADLIGPRSDFAAFAGKRVPFLFFSDGTFVDYHGVGDTADRVDYTRLAQESQLIGEVIRDGKADAVSIASIIHYNFIKERAYESEDFKSEGNTEFLRKGKQSSRIKGVTLSEIKGYLASQGIGCRQIQAEVVNA